MYPTRFETKLSPASVPEQLQDLGPTEACGFHVMHREDALSVLQGRLLPTTRELLGRPVPHILGDPERVRERSRTLMPPPFLGRIADIVPLTLTPWTAASFGSCGPRLAQGATRYSADELVSAFIGLDDLVASGLPFLDFDGNPTRLGVTASMTLRLGEAPWNLLQTSRFGSDVDPDKRAAYHREVLVYGGLPLGLTIFAFASQEALDALIADARRLGVPRPPCVVRQSFFFGK